MSRDHTGKQGAYRRNVFQIPDEDEESDKSQDERVIYLTEDLRVCQTANRQNADKQDWKRQKTGYGAKAQENIPRQQKRQRLGKVSSEVVSLPAVSSEIVSLGVNIVTSRSKTNESSENGPMLRINVSSESSKWEYRYRFWGFPTGVVMLPRLAASVWQTTTGTIRSLRFTIRSSSRANGTKVIKATSLVISMLERNTEESEAVPAA